MCPSYSPSTVLHHSGEHRSWERARHVKEVEPYEWTQHQLWHSIMPLLNTPPSEQALILQNYVLSMPKLQGEDCVLPTHRPGLYNRIAIWRDAPCSGPFWAHYHKNTQTASPCIRWWSCSYHSMLTRGLGTVDAFWPHYLLHGERIKSINLITLEQKGLCMSCNKGVIWPENCTAVVSTELSCLQTLLDKRK